MNVFQGFLLNYLFVAFASAWILSIIIKTILTALTQKKNPDIRDGFHNGGMPSSHSTVVSAITAAIYFAEGFSPLFFVALVFSLIIISDAFRLRYQVGLQGDALNKLLKKAKEKPLTVVYGHTLLQVMAGILLGIIVAAGIYLL